MDSNVAGAWYVDQECIDCDLCRTTAPDNFRANEDEGHSYVYQQPRTEEELSLCQQALEECPVEAIGCDAPCHEVMDSSALDPSVQDSVQKEAAARN